MAKDGTIKINTELDSSKAQSAMSKFSGLAKSALKGVAVAAGTVGTAMTAMAGYAIKVGSDFEAGMSKVSAISGATGSDLEALSDKAKEMGAKTKFSATEAASAFEYMAMAGWKTEDMLNGIEGVMNLAAASGEDLATTSDIVTDALTAFGLSASDSSHFADVLAAASSNANTNVSMMGETFKYVAPVAGSLGFSAEDTAVAIGLMANSGIKAGQAGTSLRAMMSRLAKPTDEVAATMDQLGISLTNSDGSMKSLNEVMVDLRSGFSGLSDAEKASAAASLAGQEAMSGLLAIVGASDADFEKLKSSIYNCDGATEKMAETMQDNLQGSLTIMKSAMEGFGIKIYEEMQDPLRAAADTGTDCINRLSDAFTEGGLHGVVDEAGEIFNDLADRIADTGEVAEGIVTPLKNVADVAIDLGKSAIPAMADAFGTLAKHLDVAVPLLVSGVTAVKGYTVAKTASSTIQKLSKAYTKSAAALDLFITANGTSAVVTAASTGAITLKQIAVGVLTKQLGLATAAQAAFNAVLKANPIGLVVTAIAALAAGIGIAVLMSDKETEATAKLTEKQKELRKSVDETKEKVDQLKEAREENIKSATKEIDTTDVLWTELQTLVDENGRVKAGYEARAGYITGELASALGLEMELVDGVVQGYTEQIDTINNLIEAKRAQAVLETMESDYQDALQNKTSAMMDYLQAQRESTQAENELREARQNLNDITKQADEELSQYGYVLLTTSVAQKEAQAEVDQLAANYKTLSKTTTDAKNSYQFYQDTIQQYEGLAAAIQANDAQQIQEALAKIQSDFKTFGEATDVELKQQAVKMSDNMALLGEAVKNGIIDASDSSVAETANLTAKALGELSKLPDGAAGVAAEIDPAMLGALAGLADSLSTESKAAVAGFIEGLNSENISDKTRTVFENAVKGAIEGTEFGDEVSSKAKELGISYLDALREVMEVHSPSRAVKRIFSQAMPGAAEGLDEGKEEVLEKAGSFVMEFLGKFSESGIGEKLKEIGSNAMSFFGIGISSQVENSRASGQENADAANAGAGSVNPFSTGAAFGSLLGGGVGSMISHLFSQGKGLADSADSGADSVDPTPTGETFGSQYASGVGSKTGESEAEGQALADSSEAGAGTADGYTPGSDFGSGFVRGIGDWLGEAANAAANLALSAYKALRNALEEKSPSKKTKKSGKYFSQGLGIGIKDNEDYAISAASEVAENALEALDMDRISAALQNINIPQTMERINAAIDDKHYQVAERITAAAVAREKSRYAAEGNTAGKLEIDYKRLEKALSKRPVIVSATLNGRELIRMTASPMAQQIQEDNDLKIRLNGGRT